MKKRDPHSLTPFLFFSKKHNQKKKAQHRRAVSFPPRQRLIPNAKVDARSTTAQLLHSLFLTSLQLHYFLFCVSPFWRISQADTPSTIENRRAMTWNSILHSRSRGELRSIRKILFNVMLFCYLSSCPMPYFLGFVRYQEQAQSIPKKNCEVAVLSISCLDFR